MFVRSSAVTFIWSAVIYRMSWRCSERVYRLVHPDDRTYLPEPLHCCGADWPGTRAIGAFDDLQIADVLKIEGDEEFVVY